MAAVANDWATTASVITLAVSETDDPTGNWCSLRWTSLTGELRLALMASEMTLSFNRDAIYFTTDLYESGRQQRVQALNFDHARAFFLSKSIYYAGRTVRAAGRWYRINGLRDADGRPRAASAWLRTSTARRRPTS